MLKVIVARLKDNCCIVMVEKERIISINTARPDGRSYVRRLGPMEGATFEDLKKGKLLKQVMIGIVTVRRPLKRLKTAKKVALPRIKPRTSGFSCQCSSH